MDLIILLVIVALVIFFFKDFTSFVYGIGIIELFFKLVHLMSEHIGSSDFSLWVNKNFPVSIEAILAKYSSGLLYDVFCWLLIICYLILLFNLIKYVVKRK